MSLEQLLSTPSYACLPSCAAVAATGRHNSPSAGSPTDRWLVASEILMCTSDIPDVHHSWSPEITWRSPGEMGPNGMEMTLETGRRHACSLQASNVSTHVMSSFFTCSARRVLLIISLTRPQQACLHQVTRRASSSASGAAGSSLLLSQLPTHRALWHPSTLAAALYIHAHAMPGGRCHFSIGTKFLLASSLFPAGVHHVIGSAPPGCGCFTPLPSAWLWDCCRKRMSLGCTCLPAWKGQHAIVYQLTALSSLQINRVQGHLLLASSMPSSCPPPVRRVITSAAESRRS